MAFAAPFSRLTRFVDGLERSGVELHRVSADDGDLVVDGSLAVTVEFGVSVPDAIEAGWADVEVDRGSLDADGTLSVALSVSAPLLPEDLAVEASDVAVTAAGDSLLVSLPVEIPVEDAAVESLPDGAGAVLAAPAAATADRSGGMADRAAGDDSRSGTDRTDADEPPTDDGPDGGESAPVTAGPGLATAGSAPVAADSGQDATGSVAASARNRDVPPFRDHDLLREVYESCDTFAEMTAEIGMDVTAETVRRYMIDAGIHEPDSYETGSRDGTDDEGSGTGAGGSGTGAGGNGTGAGAGEESPDGGEADAARGGTDGDEADGNRGAGTQGGADAAANGVDGPGFGTDGDGARDPPDGGDAADEREMPPDEAILADGIGLPDGVTVEGLIDAITVSNTLYEVSHALDLDRGRARDVLADLNLVDLVVGRLAMEAEQQVTQEEVVERLRSAADDS